MKKCAVCVTLALASLSTVLAQQSGQPDQQMSPTASLDWRHQFQLSSTTFTNGSQLPVSMILGSNYCT